MPFFSTFFSIVKRVGWLLLLLAIFFSSLEYWLTTQIQAEVSSLEGTSGWLWVLGGASLVVSLLAPLFSILLILAALKSTANPLWFFSQHFSQTLIEQVRAMGKILSWSLLLIIPGFIRFMDLLFVPFIVTMDSNYQSGRLDALKHSTRIFRSNWFKILNWVFLFSVVLPLSLTAFDGYKLIFETPMEALLFQSVQVGLTIAFTLILYRIWEKSHGADVSMESN